MGSCGTSIDIFGTIAESLAKITSSSDLFKNVLIRRAGVNK